LLLNSNVGAAQPVCQVRARMNIVAWLAPIASPGGRFRV
jgi:hypothetical protein